MTIPKPATSPIAQGIPDFIQAGKPRHKLTQQRLEQQRKWQI